MNEVELNALTFLKNKDYQKAANLYLKLALENPNEEKYFITAANCNDSLGDKKKALSLYKKALSINPNSTTTLLNLSTIYYELKNFEKSIYYANKVLEDNPNNFSAILNLGNALYADKEYEDALACYEKLYELNPKSYNAVANIANTSYNLNQQLKALDYAKLAIDMRPNSVEPYIIAGNAYVELLQNDEAAQLLKKAANIAPNSQWVLNSISNLFTKMGNYKQAINYAWKTFFTKSFQVTPNEHINFGYLLYEAYDEGHQELVEKYVTLWQTHFEDNPIVIHICSALKGSEDISTTTLDYVKHLFDNFASSFDYILNELEYCVPEIISELVKNNLKTKLFKKLKFLDLGCGTGLCSEALKPYFPNEDFFGVDISEKMLNIAGKKEIYKELYQDDIINFLAENETKYHTILAGDVITYMGDLKPLIYSLNQAIEINGYFCFSISTNIYNKKDFHLTPSGRFAHTPSYVLRLLKHCGFQVIEIREEVLRKEGTKDVPGNIILAKKE